ncbi:hypothetical protein EET67_23560 [Pseudaminobacter arsenicus]|uniref:Universal stress protein n=1 Tax=Borborobacter arsenicus TaxID=1851146 RepID=A0A432UZZ5_9HYPH|nr:hypothetical protein [Pseudaminobacter arsenicus]RUM95372.1 hypothetical protein EET67_23560 [Pseudaminobacter arsenicus]
MRYKTIMVQLDVDRRAARCLEFAGELALHFDAELIGFAAAEPGLNEAGDGREDFRRHLGHTDRRVRSAA